MKNYLCLMLSALVVLGHAPAFSQGGSPPQILTSDLSRRTVTQDNLIKATFMVIDPDIVTEVRVNNKKEKITSGGIVVVNKTISLSNTETLVEVVASDRRGATRKKSYLIIYEEQMLGPFLISPLLLPAPQIRKADTIKLLTPALPAPPVK